jgi:hypothetical protein
LHAVWLHAMVALSPAFIAVDCIAAVQDTIAFPACTCANACTLQAIPNLLHSVCSALRTKTSCNNKACMTVCPHLFSASSWGVALREGVAAAQELEPAPRLQVANTTTEVSTAAASKLAAASIQGYPLHVKDSKQADLDCQGCRRVYQLSIKQGAARGMHAPRLPCAEQQPPAPAPAPAHENCRQEVPPRLFTAHFFGAWFIPVTTGVELPAGLLVVIEAYLLQHSPRQPCLAWQCPAAAQRLHCPCWMNECLNDQV